MQQPAALLHGKVDEVILRIRARHIGARARKGRGEACADREAPTGAAGVLDAEGFGFGACEVGDPES